MTAKHAARESALRAKQIAAERKIAEARDRKEELKRQRDRLRKLRQSVKTYYLPEALKKIKSAVHSGAHSVPIKHGTDYEVAERVEKELRALGFVVRSDNYHVPADNGDPDSGEGRCDAHWVYLSRVSWGPAHLD